MCVFLLLFRILWFFDFCLFISYIFLKISKRKVEVFMTDFLGLFLNVWIVNVTSEVTSKSFKLCWMVACEL